MNMASGRRLTTTVLAKHESYSALVIPPTAEFVRRYLEPYQDKVAVIRNATDQKRLLEEL